MQIRNFGFMPPVQEPDVQHPSRPCGGAGQLRRKPEGVEPAVRHPHHTGEDGQGLGGDIFVWNYYFQQPHGVIPAVQVPAPEGAGETGHPLLRRMGGDIR